MGVSKTVKLVKTGGVVIPEDSHIGLLCGVVHLGMQKGEFDHVPTLKDEVLLQFELQDVQSKEGKVAVVNKVVTNIMNSEKATLVKIVKAMGGNTTEGVDFEELIGKPVMVGMEKNSKDKVVPKTFTPVPRALKGEIKPLQTTPKILLEVEDITDAQAGEFLDWIRDKIKTRVKSNSDDTTTNESDDADLL